MPHPALEVFFDEIQCAPTTEELVNGVYQSAMYYLATEIERYHAETHPLTDAPSRRVLKFALLELSEMRAIGIKACLMLPGVGSDWMNILEALMEETMV